jgi:hypothetical protein
MNRGVRLRAISTHRGGGVVTGRLENYRMLESSTTRRGSKPAIRKECEHKRKRKNQDYHCEGYKSMGLSPTQDLHEEARALK